jgi:hypothetical protein
MTPQEVLMMWHGVRLAFERGVRFRFNEKMVPILHPPKLTVAQKSFCAANLNATVRRLNRKYVWLFAIATAIQNLGTLNSPFDGSLSDTELKAMFSNYQTYLRHDFDADLAVLKEIDSKDGLLELVGDHFRFIDVVVKGEVSLVSVAYFSSKIRPLPIEYLNEMRGLFSKRLARTIQTVFWLEDSANLLAQIRKVQSELIDV